MPSYVVLYKFTPEGVKNIRDSIKRAGRIRQQNAAAGFKINEILWTQGPYDMVAIVEAPTEEQMMGAMLNVVSAGNVTSTTMRAFDATAMSRILATVPSLEEETPAPKKAAASRNGKASSASRNGRSTAKAGARR
jgi:uncharacterized protein with GYD domain